MEESKTGISSYQQCKKKRLKFALEGLSCSACVMTVTDAMQSYSFSSSSVPSISANIKINLHHDESLRVSLLPDPQLELIYSICSPTTSTVLKDEDEEVIESALITDIIDTIESIGFEAELTSSIEIQNQDNSNDLEEGIRSKHTDNINSTQEDPIRSLYFEVEINAHIVSDILKKMKHIHSVKFVKSKNSKKKKKNVKDYENILEDALQQQLIIDNATIEISYDYNEIGIRTILSNIEADENLQINGGCGKPIKVTDISSYQSMLAKSEERRQTEIDQYFKSFLFSAICAIPVTLVSMVFVHIPGMKQGLHSFIFWHITWEEMIAWVLTTPVQFYSGARFYREAYYSIKTRHLGMGFLIAAGTTAAYLYSVFVIFYNATRNAMMEDRLMQAFETSALLIMFVLLGKYLECKVKSFTSKAISKLSQLTPETATLVGYMNKKRSYQVKINEGDTDEYQYESTTEQKIPLILLQMNDVLLVRPGEKVPSDGVVIQGSTSIDESMLTGESMPVHKEKDDAVIGGTINIDGTIHIKVNAVGKDTALSKIISLIESAQTSKAPIQDFADSIAAKFVPVVTAISLFTYILWAILLNTGALDGVKDTWPYKKEGLNDWTLPLLFSISCLVIACPCALGLATPTAVMVGSGVSAKYGILIKGGGPLEAANKISAVVFDKTGTLTYGTPVVKDVLLLSDRCAFLSFNDDDVIGDRSPERDKLTTSVVHINEKALRTVVRFAACAEYGSEHPLAKGILSKAEELNIGVGLSDSLFPAEDFIVEVGSGIKCSINGHDVVVGNRRSLHKHEIKISQGTYEAMEFLEKKGQTAIVVSIDGHSEAVVGLIDRARQEAALVISSLRENMGVKTYMLTGDNKRTARVVAAEIGIHPDHVISEVLPEGKVDCIKRLQDLNENVCMIGDGINDAAAMAQADVGIAIGAGTDVAIETAGIVLMNSKLTDVVLAIDLSRKVFNRIKLNFVWALGYNTLAIPIAAGMLYPVIQMALPPFMAAVAMILSSLSVLTSSLLLNRYKFGGLTDKSDASVALGAPRMILKDVGSSDVMVYGSSEVASVCKSMREGGMCSCNPELCACQGCTIHNNAHNKLKKSEVIYPGCGRLWNNECSCQPCQCGISCCTK